MLNKHSLLNKYKKLIPPNKEVFLKDLSFVKKSINFKALSNDPMLIYTNNKRSAIYYLMLIHLSLVEERILDYSAITGQSLIDQHFLTEENRDMGLHENIKYTDVSFINLSQFDYTSKYAESLIIDLLEFRALNGKITIILYDVMEGKKINQSGMSKTLEAYFNNRRYPVLNLLSDKATVFDTKESDANKEIPVPITKKGGRIT